MKANLEMNNTLLQKNAKKVVKKLRKRGSNMCKTVNVKRGYWADAKPNRCNVNAIEFMQTAKDKDRYILRFGYVVNNVAAVAHVWNVDTVTGEHIDVTPLPSNDVGVYVDATDILLEVYAKTWDMTEMNPFVFLKGGRIKEFDYEAALRIAGVE